MDKKPIKYQGIRDAYTGRGEEGKDKRSSSFISTLIFNQHHEGDPSETSYCDEGKVVKSVSSFTQFVPGRVHFLVQTLHPLILKFIHLFFICHSLTRALREEKQGVARASMCEDGTPHSLMELISSAQTSARVTLKLYIKLYNEEQVQRGQAHKIITADSMST